MKSPDSLNSRAALPVYDGVSNRFPENMTASPRSHAAELRARIAQLRQDLAVTTEGYHAAKKHGQHSQVILLLRKRSALVQELFHAQSELLLVFRSPENLVASNGEAELEKTGREAAESLGNGTPASG